MFVTFDILLLPPLLEVAKIQDPRWNFSAAPQRHWGPSYPGRTGVCKDFPGHLVVNFVRIFKRTTFTSANILYFYMKNGRTHNQNRSNFNYIYIYIVPKRFCRASSHLPASNLLPTISHSYLLPAPTSAPLFGFQKDLNNPVGYFKLGGTAGNLMFLEHVVCFGGDPSLVYPPCRFKRICGVFCHL